ncbi:MAG: rod shape-determining protein, partial [Clostridia bacterium]|nr:rod shape-determining protein [Clostridia bacterium]
MLFRRQDIAIDLGTASVLIFIKGKGIVLREPSVVALDAETGRVEGVGFEAQRMLGRAPETITVVRPLKDGVISDYETTQQMLGMFMRKAIPQKSLFRPRIIMCVPSGVTDVEQRSVLGAAQKLGARNVYIMEEPKAAAIGADIDIQKPHGSMIVDIGGGTTDIALISLAGIVYSKSVRVGGDEMDNAIITHMRNRYNLLIGERTAEEIKMTIGSAYPLGEEL